jgi:hypothetical protein
MRTRKALSQVTDEMICEADEIYATINDEQFKLWDSQKPGCGNQPGNPARDSDADCEPLEVDIDFSRLQVLGNRILKVKGCSPQSIDEIIADRKPGSARPAS